MITCPICGNEVPEGEYCGACGAHLPTRSAYRSHSFAADPEQHILQPNVISTLFPHLPHRHSTPFRLALLVLGVLLLILGLLRFTGPAIALASAGIPLLYLVYLLEAEVCEDEPLLVIGLTAGLGLLLGIPWAIITGPIVTRALMNTMTFGLSWRSFLVAGVLLPLLAQVLMLIGPIVLYLRGRHREALDGFAFGAAAALGFTLATALFELAPELHQGLVGGAPPLTSMLATLGRGLLIPLLNAGTTALIGAALYLRRLPRRTLPFSWLTSVGATVSLASVVRIVLGTIDVTVLRLGVVAAIYLVIAAIVLIWVRLALHTILLVQAEDATVGPVLPCLHCHRAVPRMAYCPHCGIATESTPKVGPGVARRGRVSSGAPTASRQPDVARTRFSGRTMRWSALAGVLLGGAVALGIVAALLTPSRPAACRVTCAPPPPPCLLTCKHASSAPPLQTHSTYTSSAFGYSVDYTQFSPSRQDSQSVGWDLQTDSGTYSVDVAAGDAHDRSAGEVVSSVIDNNFPDYTSLYDVPGAEVGYAPGAGAVYDNEVTPFFGTASDSRLVILAAVKKGLAIAVVGSGDASGSQGGHPDPSGLPVSSFVDDLANGTRWPGDPAR